MQIASSGSRVRAGCAAAETSTKGRSRTIWAPGHGVRERVPATTHDGGSKRVLEAPLGPLATKASAAALTMPLT